MSGIEESDRKARITTMIEAIVKEAKGVANESGIFYAVWMKKKLEKAIEEIDKLMP